MNTAQDLDRRIVIQRATVTQNALNEDVETWGTYTTIWAKRTDVADGEKNAAGQVGSYVMARFVVRSTATTKAIKASDRVSYDGTWSIHGMKETQDGRNRFLELTCAKDAD